MASKRLNVLVYSGKGSTTESVRQALYTLRQLLTPNYAVLPVTADAILKEPWTATCAMLVMPGGADLGYCETFNGAGNRKIAQFVYRGGAYLGLCAGGYYGSARCEFEVGDPKMEVIGSRELSFFPGTCRGLAFPGFVYGSDEGARAAGLKICEEAFKGLKGGEDLKPEFKSYYNGGGVFVDAEQYEDRNVEILATYTEALNVESGKEKAAMVHCKVGEGHVVLSGVHPEFMSANLKPGKKGAPPSVIEAIRSDEEKRVAFLRACLRKMKLRVNEEDQPVPSLSSLHLSSENTQDTHAITRLMESWQPIIVTSGRGEQSIRGENDSFILQSTSSQPFDSLTDSVKSVSIQGEANKESTDDRIPLDCNGAPKLLMVYKDRLPKQAETPSFDHEAYFAALTTKQLSLRSEELEAADFGKYLLFGEVVTSTNTILEKNPSLLSHLPSGLTMTATTQILGRGRGTNTWVSPPGALIFSTVLRHPITLTHAPIVFIQYLAAIAVVQGIKSYSPSSGSTHDYSILPIRLKWPNDIYTLDPVSTPPSSPAASRATRPILNNSERSSFVKLGGVLVNAASTPGNTDSYTLVAGIGLNLSNESPTTNLDALASAYGLPPFRKEELLASILVRFGALVARFRRRGWDRAIQEEYTRHWLHSEQLIAIESAGGMRARVKGVSGDWGFLLVEEVDETGRSRGRVEKLQSDSNSFDFLKGLIKVKT